ncbi:MAG: hypothetical protein D6714_15080 [Bacteroidetes bacterium]|nr:MAG: hypothetical protein D6714_15080 [Bacteroidota bacterium]
MKIKSAFSTLLFVLVFGGIATAQIEFAEQKIVQSKGVALGVTDLDMIDELMLTMPGLGSNTREMLTEQSVKPYLMPPRQAPDAAQARSYMLAQCLEFYVNFDRNYKVNLSPDFIELSLGGSDYALSDAFRFLATTGTVSAAILPYESKAITAATYATDKYRISNYLHLFHGDQRTRQKIFEIKKALMRGNPALIEMAIPEDFEDLKNTKMWIPESKTTTKTGLFLVVSYDENLEMFEILGAYGNEWGRNGYLWVGYEDLARLARDGYVFLPEE